MLIRCGSLALSAIALLTACGGEDSTASGQAVTTLPTQGPTPTPTPTMAGGALNVRVGLKQMAEFPTLSWLYRPEVAGDANGTDLIRFGWDAARNLSVATVPGYQTGGLIEFVTETTDDISFSHVDPTYGSLSFFDRGIAMSLLVPGPQNKTFPLEYTSVGSVGWQGIATAYADKISGSIVYGVPTTSSEIPTAGTTTYAAYGNAVSRQPGQTGLATHLGTFAGSLSVDFANRIITGDLGSAGKARIALAPSNIGADGTFSGTLTFAGDPGPLTFEGRFTGPEARELMLRWRTSDQFGTLAGRRD